MTAYLVIASRDPYSSSDVERTLDVVEGLRKGGHEVTLFLVENGVLPARRSAGSSRLTTLAQQGVRVLADDYSLKERGIDDGRMCEGVQSASIDVVVDQLGAGARAFWH